MQPVYCRQTVYLVLVNTRGCDRQANALVIIIIIITVQFPLLAERLPGRPADASQIPRGLLEFLPAG